MATAVGNTGDSFAALAFSDSGQLYGLTGDGATVPETLFTIDKSTGVAIPLLPLGAGSDGEAMEYNPDDGMIYHLSGRDTDLAYERIDLNTLIVTPIAVIGTPLDEAFGMVYNGSGTFLVSNLDSEWWHVNVDGTMTNLGPTPHFEFLRGMAYTLGSVPAEQATWGRIKARYAQ